ncbi:UNVERIFIED_CONTAM: hypothetical protein Slati_1344600 [Sesamum latifolium]|uniref:Reverse transcriptase domain-containing protein n=1 Tax=Sesamum latifolium TaxID=2727402 RepID=A0AAW2XJ10_9LAMI
MACTSSNIKSTELWRCLNNGTWTFGNVFTTVQQAKQDATDAEKKFDRDPSEANLFASTKASATPDFPFQFSKIPKEVGYNICSIPSEVDIKEIVFSINKESIAGLDGFSSTIYQACWEFIARDIYDAVKDFFSGTPMPRSFIATTIVLIPKVDSPQTWNDFRLISDNILMEQEMIHHLDLRYKNNNLIIKLDMSKAYDRVNWAFLITVMQKMGFPPRFLTLIKHAVQNCWFKVLINGEAVGLFKSTQRLRQGDPISPALFILAAEAFSKCMDFLFNAHLDMFYQAKCAVKLSHISSADDVIIFTNCKEVSLIRLIGLGIRILREMVTAFSYKLWWRLRLIPSSRDSPLANISKDILHCYPNSSLLTRVFGKEYALFGQKHKLTYSGAWEMELYLSSTIGSSRKAFLQTWLEPSATFTSRSTGFGTIMSGIFINSNR